MTRSAPQGVVTSLVTWAFAGILGYLALQLGIGAYVSRRIVTTNDYLLAGRSLGPWLGTFTIFATWFGAETCLGTVSRIGEHGIIGVLVDPLGYALALVLFGLIIAVPLHRRGVTTLADLVMQRFGGTAEWLTVLLMVPTSILWAAAQIRAFGQVLGHASGFDITLMTTLAALVVIIYTTSGGLMADAWTDIIQGIVLIVGMIVLAVVALPNAPPIAPERWLTPPGMTWLDALEKLVPVVCGSLVAQELAQRALASRSATQARRSTFIAAFVYVLIGGLAVMLGLTFAHHGEDALLTIADAHLSGFAYVIFAGALLSTILSTVDSALLVAGALLAHNIVRPLAPALAERRGLLITRSAVVASGVVAYGLALFGGSVYELVETASAFGSSGLVVVVLAALFGRRGTAWGACASLVVGAALHAIGSALDWRAPYLTALGVAAGLYMASNLGAQSLKKH